MGFVSVFSEVNQEMLLITEVTGWIFDGIISEKYAALKLTGLGIYTDQYCPEQSLIFTSHCQFMVRYFP